MKVSAYIGRLERKDRHDTFTDNDGVLWVLIPITIQLNGWVTTFLMPVPPDQEDWFYQLGAGAKVDLEVQEKTP